jgi:hypothetical protein
MKIPTVDVHHCYTTAALLIECSFQTPSLTGILVNRNSLYEELRNPNKQEILWLALRESEL